VVVAGIIVNARDVTERRQAEDELVRSHHLLEAIIEGTTDTIFVKDVDGRCLMINAAGASLLGREKREVIGKTDHDLFRAELAARITEADSRAITSGRPVTYALSGVGSDGRFQTHLKG